MRLLAGLSIGLATIGAVAAQPARAASAARPPNIVVFFCDNLGYGDTTLYGPSLHRTPNLDQMALEGRKFTHFYTSANVCTASRAGLMTGSYAQRVSLYQNVGIAPVLNPAEPIGLNPSELTMAEMMKQGGYTTMLIGKWHLGDQPAFFPTRHGFDQYWGVPYSDDLTAERGKSKGVAWPPLPLMRGETVIEAPVDRDQLTRRETEEAIRFITAQREKPFFLIISHAMPGSSATSFASEAFRGRSKNERYGDAVEELDWSAGEIMGAIKRLGIDDNTLVIWTADNSASRRSGRGSNAPFSGHMVSTSEGGFRVPFVARWPGRIPAGTECSELSTMMDLLPSFASLVGVQLPSDRKIDGKNIWPLLSGQPGARTPHETFYYYQFEQLQAVRTGPWKVFLPLERKRGYPAQPLELVNSPVHLYNVVDDPREERDLAQAQPDIVARLLQLAQTARRELGDLDRPGTEARPAGWVFQPRPPVLSPN